MEEPQSEVRDVERQEETLETVSRDQLITLVREKTKEAKALATKNSRLENKYLTLFKQAKLIRKDHTTFIEAFEMIFGASEQKPLGSWELGEIREKWDTRERVFNSRIQDLISQQKEQREGLEFKIRGEIVEQYKAESIKSSQKQEQLQNQLQQVKLYNEKLLKQISNLHEGLGKQKGELVQEKEKRKEFEMELNRIKVNEAKKELEKTMGQPGKKEEDAQARTEILHMRQEIDSLHSKIDDLNEMINKLQTKLRAKYKEIEILKEKNESYSQQPQYPPPVSPPQKPELVLIPLEKNPSQKERDPKQKEIQPLQKEYFKNIFIRFMKCLNESNYLQAQTLENVLMTLLEFDKRERDQAAIRQKTWWSIFQ